MSDQAVTEQAVTERAADDVRVVGRDDYLSTISALDDAGYTMCIDLTAVDYLLHPARKLPVSAAPTESDADPESIAVERFEVVVNLLDIHRRQRVRVRVQVPADDPTLPTLFNLYPGTEAMEREVYDMFGIVFDGHPDLTRILMPEDWIGHPLRKDYEIGRIPVQFKGANT